MHARGLLLSRLELQLHRLALKRRNFGRLWARALAVPLKSIRRLICSKVSR